MPSDIFYKVAFGLTMGTIALGYMGFVAHMYKKEQEHNKLYEDTMRKLAEW